MRGGEGLDSMDGGAGNDEMHVEACDDVAVCNSGNDRMLGDFISGLFS
jgi:Ca2+-binding RTX toxin-like protein